MSGQTAKNPHPDGYGNFAHQHNRSFPLIHLGSYGLNKWMGSDYINLFFSNAKRKKESSNKRNEIANLFNKTKL